ncbi:MAG: hypothetical protein WCS51_00195 [Bacilli bacterium]|mgnify:CR=1 FL=1|jgi:cellobiose-specific phosphotransferase system component IIC
MNRVALTDSELDNIRVGEAITIAAVMAVMVIAITAVCVYRLFMSKSSTIKLPGGWQFTWK